tara:strand:+ start:1446 stop:1844 length:399 start_codon:yes stop_codon:yes gene_type:complete
MKTLFLFILILFSGTLYSQNWVTDKDIHSKISSQSQFDDGHSIVVIEFWAEFNKDNAFKDWKKLQGVQYYRCDVAKSPESKKEFRIRMAPTIIIFVDGVKEEVFKAGLDLLCPVELPELNKAIQQAQKSSQF